MILCLVGPEVAAAQTCSSVSGVAKIDDPVVRRSAKYFACDQAGNIYAAYRIFVATAYEVALAYSPNYGETWYTLYTTTYGQNQDGVSVAITSENIVYVAFVGKVGGEDPTNSVVKVLRYVPGSGIDIDIVYENDTYDATVLTLLMSDGDDTLYLIFYDNDSEVRVFRSTSWGNWQDIGPTEGAGGRLVMKGLAPAAAIDKDNGLGVAILDTNDDKLYLYYYDGVWDSPETIKVTTYNDYPLDLMAGVVSGNTVWHLVYSHPTGLEGLYYQNRIGGVWANNLFLLDSTEFSFVALAQENDPATEDTGDWYVMFTAGVIDKYLKYTIGIGWGSWGEMDGGTYWINATSSLFPTDGYSRWQLPYNGFGYTYYDKGAGNWGTGDEQFMYCFGPEDGMGYGEWPPSDVTTLDASHIALHTAHLHGRLDNDRGLVTEMRFYVSNTTDGFYTDWTDGYYTGDIHTEVISNLANCTLYTFHAEARNAIGEDIGGNKTFTTLCTIQPPTNVVAYADTDSITLNWVKGVGSTGTYIRYRTSHYPADVTDGNLWGRTVGSSSKLLGLEPGTNYYISLWGYSGNEYSANCTSVMVTTTSGMPTDSGGESPGEPELWFLSINYTRFSKMPLYNEINNFADSLKWPRGTMWIMGYLLFAVAIALGILAKSRDDKATLWVFGILLVGGSVLGFLPLWWFAFYAMAMVGLWVFSRSSRRSYL